MGAFRSILFTAVLAGLIAGVFVSVLHMAGTARIIARAETFEKAAEAAPAPGSETMPMPGPGAGESMSAHEHEEGGWEPANGFERTLFTVLADILTGIGFALLLVSAYAMLGRAVDWRRGLYWGLAGFAIFTIAPGIGLPPEVPGTEAAPLVGRQIWWVATAAATAGGLALIFLTERAVWAVVGIALLVLPHLVGAPQPAAYKSAAPEALAREFAVAAIVTSFLFWLTLGTLTAFIYGRFRRSE